MTVIDLCIHYTILFIDIRECALSSYKERFAVEQYAVMPATASYMCLLYYLRISQNYPVVKWHLTVNGCFSHHLLLVPLKSIIVTL